MLSIPIYQVFEEMLLTLNSFILLTIGYKAKLNDPALKVAISGYSSLTTAILSSGVMVAVPPVVGVTTKFVLAFIPLKIPL